MTRVPESLERVRALVCEFCWVNCFDTAEFEQLGRGEIKEFEYNVGEFQRSFISGCTLCVEHELPMEY
jgi:Pyruvate/2-oxoacid:ferredoxin oxidoreductase delta subunit